MRPSSLAAAALVCLASTPALAAPNGPPARNGQKPIHLTWEALLELNMPGIGGLRGDVSFYMPGVPLYLNGGVAYSWGGDPSHGEGSRDDYWTRMFTETLTWEARAGVSFERYRVPMEVVDFNYDYVNWGFAETWRTHSYLVQLPTYYRDTFYLGYRNRSTPGAPTCKANGRTPAGCSELDSGFLMLGWENLVARNAAFDSQEHGTLYVGKKEVFGLHALFTVHDDTRKDFVDHLGVEAYWATMDQFGYRVSIGWDGRYFLMTIGVGGANMHSFADQPKPTNEL